MGKLYTYNGSNIEVVGGRYDVPWGDVAHQGLGGSTIPLNTLPAFHKAYLDGAACVEFDIRKTSDGVFVIRHDSTINGTEISNMPWSTLKTIVLSIDEEYGEITTATLDQVLKLCRFYKLTPVLHVYVDTVEDVEAVAKAVLRNGMAGKCQYNMNSYTSTQTMVAKAKEIIAIDSGASFHFAYANGLTADTYSEITTNNSQIIITIYSRTESMSAEYVNDIREMGYKTYMWSVYTDNDIKIAYGSAPDFIEYGDNFYVSDIRSNYLNTLNLTGAEVTEPEEAVEE